MLRLATEASCFAKSSESTIYIYILIGAYYRILLLLLYCYSIRRVKWFPVHKNNIIYRLDVFTASWNTCPRRRVWAFSAMFFFVKNHNAVDSILTKRLAWSRVKGRCNQSSVVCNSHHNATAACFTGESIILYVVIIVLKLMIWKVLHQFQF